MTSPRILTVDIETSPMLSYHFSTRQVNISIDQIKLPSRMICWAAKWLDEKRVLYRSEYHDDTAIMRRHLFDLLDEADVVVGWNSDRFDIRKIRREFRLANLGQPSSFVSVDLLKQVRKLEEWDSHKLAWVTKQLGLSGKLDNDGWPLWISCVDPDVPAGEKRRAWSDMRRYNKQDVVTTEEVFIEYRADITNLPHASLWTGDVHGPMCCRVCESLNLTKQGFKHTRIGKFQRYQCRDCGGWSTSGKAEMRVDLR